MAGQTGRIGQNALAHVKVVFLDDSDIAVILYPCMAVGIVLGNMKLSNTVMISLVFVSYLILHVVGINDVLLD